jgi:Large polyvalent protein associated domain 38
MDYPREGYWWEDEPREQSAPSDWTAIDRQMQEMRGARTPMPEGPVRDPSLGAGGLTPDFGLTDLAPEFVRLIPTAAIEEAQRHEQAAGWLTNVRAVAADRWRDLRLNELWEIMSNTIGAPLEGLRERVRSTDIGDLPESALDIRYGPTMEERAPWLADLLSKPLPEILKSLPAGAAITGAEELLGRPVTGRDVWDVAGGEAGMGFQMPFGVAGRTEEAVRGVKALEGTHAMWEKPPSRPVGALRAGARWIEEKFADALADLNRVGPNAEEAVALFRGRGAAVQQAINDTVRPVLSLVGRDGELGFNDYLKLQRDIEVGSLPKFVGQDRLYSGGVKSVADAQAKLAELEQAVGPEVWQRYEQADVLRTRAFADLLDRKVTEGIIPRTLADHLAVEQPHYNPVRFLEQVEGGRLPLSGGRFVMNTNTIRRLTRAGSEADTQKPLEAFVAAMAEGELAIWKNRTSRAVIGDLRSNPEYAGLVARVPNVKLTTGTEIRRGVEPGMTAAIGPEHYSNQLREWEAARRAAREAGMPFTEPRPKAPDVQATVAGHKPPIDIPGVVSVFEDGERVFYKVPEPIERAMKNLDPAQLHLWERVVSGMNQLTRAGLTTLSPSFTLTNVLADAVTTFVREGAATAARIPRGWWHAARMDQVYRDYVAAGAGQAGYWNKPPEEVLNEIRRTGGIVVNTPKELAALVGKNVAAGGVGAGVTAASLDPNDPNYGAKVGAAGLGFAAARPAISRANEILELGPRLATFEARQAAGQTAQQAGLAARRVTIDFQRQGEATRHMNAFLLFFSAGVGGALQTPRTLRDNPSSRLRLAGLTTAVAGSYLWNRQFPEYADVPQYIKDQFGVVMLPGSTPEDMKYLTVPLREWSVFSAPLSYALRKMDENDPRAIGDAAKDFIGQYTPAVGAAASEQGVGGSAAQFIPPAGRTAVELLANKNFYTGNRIVPGSLEGLPKSEQITERTSRLAQSAFGQTVGGLLGLSPVQFDFAVRGVFGTLGRTILDYSNVVGGQPTEGTLVLSGLARGVLRTYGGQVDEDLRNLRDATRDQYAQELVDAFRASPGAASLLPSERQAADRKFVKLATDLADYAVYGSTTTPDELLGKVKRNAAFTSLPPEEQKARLTEIQQMLKLRRAGGKERTAETERAVREMTTNLRP